MEERESKERELAAIKSASPNLLRVHGTLLITKPNETMISFNGVILMATMDSD